MRTLGQQNFPELLLPSSLQCSVEPEARAGQVAPEVLPVCSPELRLAEPLLPPPFELGLLRVPASRLSELESSGTERWAEQQVPEASPRRLASAREASLALELEQLQQARAAQKPEPQPA